MEKAIMSVLGLMQMSTFGLGADLNKTKNQFGVMMMFININIYLAILPVTSSITFLSHLSGSQVVLLAAWMTFTFAHLMMVASDLYFVGLMYSYAKLEQIKNR
ncbi:hypothetical protein [Bdellovibrio sp. BCCA]|uniref:hypothetical protein n=1 Tax=Bdellovibrio sp. BCCA TaxID=3136281 RepID=UPI0030F302F2